MMSLNVVVRAVKGKKVRELRAVGTAPCVLYGPKIDPVNLQVNTKELEAIYRKSGSSTLISLVVDGDKDREHVILIYDLQKNPVSKEILHADFYELPLDKEITLQVPLILDNEAPGVRDEGGTLVHSIHEIEIKALPTKLPSELRVDISTLLHLNDSLHIKDITVPEGVEILNNSDDTIAFIEEPREEEIIEEELEEESADDIKTESEVKREEEEGTENEEQGEQKSE